MIKKLETSTWKIKDDRSTSWFWGSGRLIGIHQTLCLIVILKPHFRWGKFKTQTILDLYLFYIYYHSTWYICDISSHATRNAQRGGNCCQETDDDLKNGLPSVCFHFTHFDSILKVKLIFLCVSHEVNFPLVYWDFGRVGVPRQLHSGGGRGYFNS